MSYHLTSHSFRNEFERRNLELELQAQGFRQVDSMKSLQPGDYQLKEGSSDPNGFEGQPTYGIEWCEDK